MQLRCSKRLLDLSQPQVMGILNVTPDSFSDGGRHNGYNHAVARAEVMVAQGATIIDIGGESTRPGAQEVTLDDELARTIPVIEAIRAQSEVMISIDTSKAEVMRQAIAAGANIINDVRALQEPGALQAAADTDAAICLMHMQGRPRTMQHNPQYDDLFTEINQFFGERIDACEQHGIDRQRLILDPGFGFGKTLKHNYQLLANLELLRVHRLPLLIGLSRKSMIGDLLQRPVEQRLSGSIAAALVAVQQGAEVIRVHDVQETADAINVWRFSQQLSS